MKNFPSRIAFQAFLAQASKGNRLYFDANRPETGPLSRFLKVETGKRFVVTDKAYGPLGKDPKAKVPSWVAKFVGDVNALGTKYVSVDKALELVGGVAPTEQAPAEQSAG